MNKWKLFVLLGLILLIIGGIGLFFRQDEVVENIESIEFKLDNSNRKQTEYILIDKDAGKFNVVIDTTGLSLDMICTITVDSSNKNLKFYTDKNYSNELSEYNYIQNNEKKTITIYYRGNNIIDEQVSINVENEVKHKKIQTEIESIEFRLDDSDRRQTKSIVIDRDIDMGEFNIVIDTTVANSNMDCTITVDSSDKNLKFYTDKNYSDELSKYNFIQYNDKQTITIYFRGNNKTSNAQVDINIESKSKTEIIRDAKMIEQKENFAFWTEEYKKTIKHIIFERDISNIPKDCTEKNKCFDISSSASKNKVYAYIINNDLHIASEYEIYAPSNSSYMFKDFEKVESIDFFNFNTMDATDMAAMFKDCSSLTSLDLSNFDTSNVIYFGNNLPFRAGMHGMFSGCSSLKSLNVSSFNTANAVNMQGMFSDCSSLTSLNLSSFDTSKVTAIDFMFEDCSSLTKLDLSNFNTPKVTSMYGVFSNCSSLTSLDLSNFNTSKVEHMGGMFYNCSSLTYLDLSSFDTSNVTSMSNMFYGCSSLTYLNLSNFDTSKVIGIGISNMFYGCERIITQINIINDDYWDADNVFKNAATYEGSSIILGYTDETYETVIKMKGNNERIILKKIN